MSCTWSGRCWIAQVRGERATDRGRGLHQGSVLSPLLSNLYLDTFDRRMLGVGFRVIRYADDFAIPVESRLDGERALQATGTELADLRLELNAGKCHVVSFEDGVRFLGETVTASTLAAAETLSHPVETSVYVDRQGSMVRIRGDRLIVTQHAVSSAGRRTRNRGRVVVGERHARRAAHRAGDIRSDGSSGSVPRRGRRRPIAGNGCRIRARKINNMRVTLLRTATRTDDLDAADAADRLERAQDQVGEARDINHLLGLEGAASRDYMQGLRRMIDPEWGFAGCQRRPPPDPVNAMLSSATRFCATRRSRRWKRPGSIPWSASCTSIAGVGRRWHWT